VKRFRINARRWVRKILGLGDPPHSIALATAVGMFVAFTPTYGFQIILSATAAVLLRCNKVATVLPVFLTNPVTAPPLLFLQYLLGRAILGGGSEQDLEKAKQLARVLNDIALTDLRATLGAAAGAVRDLGWGIFGPTVLGAMISAVVVGLVTYPITYRSVVWFRRKREERAERRRLAGLPIGGAAQPAPDAAAPAKTADSAAGATPPDQTGPGRT